MDSTYTYSAGTGAVIVSQTGDQILLIEEHKAPGKWGIAGGKLERMPSLANLQKEVLEETGYAISVDKLVRVYQRFDCEPQRLSLIYRATAIKVLQPFDAAEVRELRWFRFEDIPWADLRFADNEIMIRDALSNEGYPLEAVLSLPIEP
jgi:8-oxo-dGTP pyrophosphatase MutT (NUDIX family)